MSVVLVTGAGGFVGRHLCGALLERGERVVAVTRRSSRPTPASVRRVECPTFDKDSLAAVLASERPEVIYHVAGCVDGSNVSALYETNACYASRLLDAAEVAAPDATVLCLGSAAEYGAPRRADGVVRENDACRPLGAYGISKLAGTLHALAAASRGRPVVVARLFNPVGPGMPRLNALGAFVDQVRRAPPGGGTLTTGPLHLVRDFVDIQHAVQALMGLARHPRALGQIINLCSGRGLPLARFVDRLLAMSPGPMRHQVDGGRRQTDLDVVIGDPTRLMELGLALPDLDIDDVLKRMFAES
jgi:nucleoside-diphosphate-sugar epimerase